MNTDKFQEIKTFVLRRAHESRACADQYVRACKAGDLTELLQVMKDNFQWVCRNGILTTELIERYRKEFCDNDIYLNKSTDHGFLLCADNNAEAYGNTVVAVCGKSIVNAADGTSLIVRDNASVEVYGNAFVRAYDNSSVNAWATATVEAYDNTKVVAHDYATIRAWGNSVVAADDNAVVEAYDNVTIKASGNAYCNSYNHLEFSLQGSAIYRIRSENTVYYASDSLIFKKSGE